MDGFTTKRSTSSKDPQLRAFTSQVENALENAAQEAELERIQLKNKAVQRKIPKKNTGMFVQRLKVGGKSWESTLRYQLIYTHLYIYIYGLCFF